MTPTVLLAHGAGGTTRANFGPLVAALTGVVRAYGPDFPGSGVPLPPEPLHLDDLADRLVAASDVERFAIVGYSMGCAVAVRAAVRYPERVSGLVLTAGSPCIDDATRNRVRRWRELAGRNCAELAEFVVSVLFGEPFVRSITAAQRRDLGEIATWSVPEGAVAQLDLVERIDVRGDLGAVSAPTLVLGTRHDRLVTPASMRGYADGIPGARWSLLDSGHAVAVEAPKAWARYVAGFLGADRDANLPQFRRTDASNG